MKGKVYVVGIGPGDAWMMTREAEEILGLCDTIVGYKTYVDLVRERYPDKEIIENGMRSEVERCQICVREALSGKKVALICSGDAGIYGMASPLLEEAEKDGFVDVTIVPGVTAALSGAAVLGAPLGHDVCMISLSDILTPFALIEKRLRCAAEGDFCIVLYNPASAKRADYLRRACDILLARLSPEDRERGDGEEDLHAEGAAGGEGRYADDGLYRKCLNEGDRGADGHAQGVP